MIGNKYCLRAEVTELFAEIVKRSYGMQEIEMCMKMGFVPIVVDEVIGEEVEIRVPSSRVVFKIELKMIEGLEKIGGEEMTSVQAELWRVRRSLEILKSGKGKSIKDVVIPMREEGMQERVMPSREEKLSVQERVMPRREEQEDIRVEEENEVLEEKRVVIRTIDRMKVIDERVRKIREYASGAVICDDGRERWINAEWTQTCEYVLTPE